MRRIVQFFTDSYNELRRVIWPTRQEVASSTKLVLISVILFAIFFGIIDYVFLRASDFIF